MKSRSASILALSALLLAACNAQTTIDTDSDTSLSSSEAMTASMPYLDDGSSSSDSVELNVGSSAPAQAASSQQANNGQTRVITINVTDWSFSPSMIAVAKGEKVQLKLVGGTGIHSLAVPGLGMNVRIEAGQTVTVDLPTDTAGTFDAMCRIPCGAGHKDMKATIVIS
jgi:cytochrome c oxidase subunit II